MASRLDPETLRAVRRYGPSVNGLARSYGIKGRNAGQRLLARLVIGESADDPNAVSVAGARGRTQFMPGTRQIALKKYGIDPWRSADEAVHAAVLHLKGKLTGNPGLEGYNPGDPNYPDYILSRKAGIPARGGGGAGPVAPPTLGGEPGSVKYHTMTKVDREGAILDAMMERPPGQRLGLIAEKLASGAYTTRERIKVNDPGLPTLGGDSGTSPRRGGGSVSFGANAFRPGTKLQDYARSFADGMTRWAGDFEIGTATQHSRLTTSGRVSDHWDGSGFDIPATGKRLEDLGYAALRTAGVGKKAARRMAKNGGLFNIQRNGQRIQIILKTNEGGNHWNHLHVGIRPL